ncbi:hypothetical protein AN641_04115 [Candidatus Epulonipiscioides gigas]|nr:hypothetical protein AN641_04115 [Epulopiscium sp. SCG-C07WGA-EpuloA2]
MKKYNLKNPRNWKKIIFYLILTICIIILVLFILPTGYMVQINGKNIGIIENKKILNESLEVAMAQLKKQYNAEVKLDYRDNIVLVPFKILKNNKITSNFLITYLRENLDFMIEFKQLYANGKKIGIIENEKILDDLLQELTIMYYGVDKPSKFITELTTKPTFASVKSLLNLNQLVKISKQTTKSQILYQIRKGDTLLDIAKSLRINKDEITKNNPKIKNDVIVLGSIIEVTVDVPVIDVILTGKNSAREHMIYVYD